MVVKLRFGFPDNDHPSWKTYLNEPNQTMGIKKNSESVYPDIVVVDTSKDQVAMIGEVETATTIDQGGAAQWKEYSVLCSTFYLYVPDGYAPQTKELLRTNGISVTGLRTYSYDQAGNVTVANV